MRDNGETITEATRAPPPFKLEREVTLMPKEFRERMSARHKSRKSSAARSEVRGYSSKPPTGRFKYSTENSYMSNHTHESDGGQSAYTESHYHKTVKIPHEHDQDVPSNDDDFQNDNNNNNNNHGELKSTSSHIALNGDVKFMLDNAYANYESEGGFNVRTPPQNMQIKDLMAPLDEWNSKETVQEKKYAVLPSIKHTTSNTSSDESEIYSQRNSSGYSINNQLDFFRDKIEEDADFFADFRVNTSKVKVTPRHDPLPPIKHGTKDSTSTNTTSKKKSSRKDKNFHAL